MPGIDDMDREWVQLIKEAKDLGLTLKEIYDFFEHQQIPELKEMKEEGEECEKQNGFQAGSGEQKPSRPLSSSLFQGSF